MLATAVRDIDPHRYNLLPDVDDTSKAVELDPSFVPLLAEFSDLAEGYGVTDEVGVFLLHRHFPLRLHEAIVERAETDVDGTPALISKPRPVAECDSATVVRWSVDPHTRGYFPLEASEDAGAAEAALALTSQSAFLRDYADLVVRRGFAGKLGLGVPGRTSLVCGAGEVFVERNSDEASVVTVGPEEPAKGTYSIPTMWVPTVAAYCQARYRCIQVCRGFDEPYTGSCRSRSHDRVSDGHDRRD